MSREPVIRNRSIALVNSIPLGSEIDRREHMAQYIRLATKEFGWTEHNARASYRFLRNEGLIEGLSASRQSGGASANLSKNRSDSTKIPTHPLHEARANLSELVDRALAGDPQRVTRYGKEAVMIVAEKEWLARPRSAPTLGALLAQFARNGTLNEEATHRTWNERELGKDFE